MHAIAKYNGLIGVDLREMDDDETSMFISLAAMVQMGRDINNELHMHNDLMEKSGNAYPIIVKRLQAIECDYDICVITFLAGLCDNPAKCVMWAFTYYVMDLECGVTINFDIFSDTKYFGIGLPTEEAYKTAWNAQKRNNENDYESDNMLDNFDLWRIKA